MLQIKAVSLLLHYFSPSIILAKGNLGFVFPKAFIPGAVQALTDVFWQSLMGLLVL